MALGTDKDIEKIAKAARRQGWQVDITRGNHLRFRSPDGLQTIIGSLSGNVTSNKKLKSQLMKAGVTA